MSSAMRIFGSRFALMISGEAIQSAFHFALNIIMAHRLSAHDYGVFAIAMVIGGLSLTYIRALTGMPASIWVGQSRDRPAATGYEVMFGSAALALSTIIAIIVATILQLWIGVAAVSGGLFVGLWSLRSHLRTALFARSGQRAVAAGDLSFAAGGTGLTGLLLLSGGENPLQGAFLVLALANALAIIVTIVAAKTGVRVSFRRSTRRRYVRHWRQLGWSTISVSMANLQGQGMALLVAAIAGPAAYAPIAAALLLFVPLRLVGATLVNMMQPVLAAHLAEGVTGKAWHQAITWTVLLVSGAFVYGAAIISVLPMMQIRAFEGAPIHVLGYFAWAIQIVCLLYAMPRCFLEVAKAFRVLAVINVLSAIVGMSVVTVVLYTAPPAWALAGALLSETMVLAACWIVVRSIFVPKSADLETPVGATARFTQTEPTRSKKKI
jgi:O-antigen/teichoic acid export membrane protein